MKRSKKKAFSLIEVLISIIILSIVGVGLFQISANSKHNFSYIENKKRFDALASIAFVHNNIAKHNKDKNLYEFLRYDFNLSKYDELRKILKDYNIHYSHESISDIKPFEDDNETQENMLTITINKITINNKSNQTSSLSISIHK